MSDRDEKGLFVEGNTVATGARLKHGGEVAIKRLQHGQAFTDGSPAHAAELAVYEQLDEAGLPNYLESRAVQVEAVCDLFAGEIAKAAQAGDAELLDQRVKRWGWLRGVADRTWKLVDQLRKSGPPALDYDELVKELIKNAKA